MCFSDDDSTANVWVTADINIRFAKGIHAHFIGGIHAQPAFTVDSHGSSDTRQTNDTPDGLFLLI